MNREEIMDKLKEKQQAKKKISKEIKHLRNELAIVEEVDASSFKKFNDMITSEGGIIRSILVVINNED